ncbi:MAG: hypothetical protein WCQ47_04390 [bacterium]
MDFRKLVISFLCSLVAMTAYSAEDLPQEDHSIKIFSLCGKNTSCIVAESLVFAPLFPWFQYPLDAAATNSQLRKFQRLTGSFDFLLIKANEHFSGYKLNGAFYKRWIGVDFGYETYNNGAMDQNFYYTHLIFKPFPRKHLQPKLSVGWKYLSTDFLSGGGLHISFFNYDINFSRRFTMFIVNYIGWIKKYTIVEGLLGFEYYIYPTISIKTSMDLKHIFSRSLYGMQVGLSLKL